MFTCGLHFYHSFTHCQKKHCLTISFHCQGKERFSPYFDPYFIKIVSFSRKVLFLGNKTHCALVISKKKRMNYRVASENIFPLNILMKATVLSPSISLVSLKFIIIKDNHILRLAAMNWGSSI